MLSVPLKIFKKSFLELIFSDLCDVMAEPSAQGGIAVERGQFAGSSPRCWQNDTSVSEAESSVWGWLELFEMAFCGNFEGKEGVIGTGTIINLEKNLSDYV